MDKILVGLIILFAFLSVMFLVVFFLSSWGAEYDRKERRLKSIDDKTDKDQFSELSDKSFYERVILPKFRGTANKLNSGNNALAGDDKTNAEIARKLRLAGWGISVAEYNFTKLAMQIGGVVIGILLALLVSSQGILMSLLVLVVLVFLGVLLPKTMLDSKISSRQKAMKKQMPDVIDLLTVCVEAGLSFDAGILKVTERLDGPFVDELRNTYRELQMGRPRREALLRLSTVCNINELKTFTSAIIQADQMGVPIKNVLRVQSAQLRFDRKQAAKEQGAKAPIKMLFPILLFIFPALFIVILAPGAINIMENLV